MVSPIAALTSTMFGLIGAIIWWLKAPIPTGHSRVKKKRIQQTLYIVAQRFLGGMLSAFLWYVLSNSSPFDSSGGWNAPVVIQLVVAGYAGLAALGSIIPQLDASSLEYNSPALQKTVNRIRSKMKIGDLDAANYDLHALENGLITPEDFVKKAANVLEES